MARVFTDQLDRSVTLADRPRRIVSLVPSITETLVRLGAGESGGGRLVGRTEDCIHPVEFVRAIRTVGRTKQLDLNAIHELAPDLVIAAREENVKEQVEALAERWPVFITNVETVECAIETIRILGRLIDEAGSGEMLAQQAAEAFARIQPLDPPRAALCLIWRKPWMAAGRDTYINDVMRLVRFRKCGVATSRGGGTPSSNRHGFARLAPEIVLLPSEPFPFARAHVDELRAHLPDAEVHSLSMAKRSAGTARGWWRRGRPSRSSSHRCEDRIL